ncbi:MAG TPA: hypothetical protein DEA67_00915 [Selenomonas sp.]|nr:hypothetical protein [Selenomonas sp.]
MASKYTLQFTHQAYDDLDALMEYMTIEQANPQAAKHCMDHLEEILADLRSFPGSGAAVENEFLPGIEVRKQVIGKYVLYYLPDAKGKTIYILRIVYGSRNLEEILRQIDI